MSGKLFYEKSEVLDNLVYLLFFGSVVFCFGFCCFLLEISLFDASPSSFG